MKNFLYIFTAVAIAVAANALSAVWAKQDTKFSFLLLALVLISPFVFITYGLVAARLGLAVTAATVDALLTIATIAIGIIFFKDKISSYQIAGIALSVIGILLMLYGPDIKK